MSPLARRLLRALPLSTTGFQWRMLLELLERRIAEDPGLRPFVEEMTDEQAHLHFGADEPVDSLPLRFGLRIFHGWRVRLLRERLGDRLATAEVLDVGDTDGLILRGLGKTGTGLNLAPAALANIESNGVTAVAGDCHHLPFPDASFDLVLCFETLEHVESPHSVLCEFARVCRPGGRICVSIPWVPRTNVHPRDRSMPRGAMHVAEFSPDDFAALASHAPLRVMHREVCELLGRPVTLGQRLFLRWAAGAHVLYGGFVRFQYFELVPEPDA